MSQQPSQSAKVLALVAFLGFVSVSWTWGLDSDGGSWGGRVSITVRIFLCLLFAATLHLALARSRVGGLLCKPIHQRWFGENKTWRGLVLEPLFAIPAVWAVQSWEMRGGNESLVSFVSVSPVLFGVFLGAARILGELPNSFLKRRLGIAPGTHPHRGRLWIALYDQADSTIPISIGVVLWFGLPVTECVWLILFLTISFFFGRLFLFGVGLKKSPLT
jgi:hypothetical protein